MTLTNVELSGAEAESPGRAAVILELDVVKDDKISPLQPGMDKEALRQSGTYSEHLTTAIPFVSSSVEVERSCTIATVGDDQLKEKDPGLSQPADMAEQLEQLCPSECNEEIIESAPISIYKEEDTQVDTPCEVAETWSAALAADDGSLQADQFSVPMAPNFTTPADNVSFLQTASIELAPTASAPTVANDVVHRRAYIDVLRANINTCKQTPTQKRLTISLCSKAPPDPFLGNDVPAKYCADQTRCSKDSTSTPQGVNHMVLRSQLNAEQTNHAHGTNLHENNTSTPQPAMVLQQTPELDVDWKQPPMRIYKSKNKRHVSPNDKDGKLDLVAYEIPQGKSACRLSMISMAFKQDICSPYE